MAACSRLLVAGALAATCMADGSLGDAPSLVQASVHAHNSEQQRAASSVSWAVHENPDGPLAYTQDGAIQGVYESGISIFKRIPYAETPARFAAPVPRKPWSPDVLAATSYGPGCIGSATGVPESEDCLNLNVWVPAGGQRQMPVIVYIHGGMNQHGSGAENWRQGDGITKSDKFPTIFVNFDFRLGIFGWLYGQEGSNYSNNIGMLDQQQALRWVSRNIAAFGGDPQRVALQGQSEGSSAILSHLAAPGSAGLFQRAMLHSPPADMWSREANKQRTLFMMTRTGCIFQQQPARIMDCLKKLPAQQLWSADWVSEELSRNLGSQTWLKNALGLLTFSFGKKLEDMTGFLGWHPIVDGVTLMGEPRDLIAEGKASKIPILITVSKNESLGCFPGENEAFIKMGMSALTRKGEMDLLQKRYNQTLSRSGIIVNRSFDLLHQMITDKMWTCDVRSLARDITRGGGQAYVGMFWHSPKYDPAGRATNAVCEHGATCHAAEMFYALPQGHGIGIAEQQGLQEEAAFAERYRDEVLSFVHGGTGPWVPYNTDTQPITFYDEHGARVMPRYRKEQCDVLDASMASTLPAFMLRQQT